MRDNILLGLEFDPDRYNAVIQACALEPVSAQKWPFVRLTFGVCVYCLHESRECDRRRYCVMSVISTAALLARTFLFFRPGTRLRWERTVSHSVVGRR